MANYTGKAVCVTASITFGGTSYNCKSIPCGIPQSADLPNVTTLSDNVQKFAAAGVTEDGEISAVLTTAPTLNATGALSIALSVSIAGAAATSSSVSVGNCIVTGIEPSTIEAGGDRVRVYTVTFKPDGTRV